MVILAQWNETFEDDGGAEEQGTATTSQLAREITALFFVFRPSHMQMCIVYNWVGGQVEQQGKADSRPNLSSVASLF